MERRFAFLHTEPGGCGLVAFYMEHMPVVGQYFASADAELPNGSRPQAHSQIKCGSCGELIVSNPTIADVVPVA